MSTPPQATSSSEAATGDEQATQAPPTNQTHPHSPPPNDEYVANVYNALSRRVPNGKISNTTTKTDIGSELILEKFENIDWVATYNETKQYIELFPDEQAQVKIWRTGNLVVSGPAMPEKIIDLIARTHGHLRELGIDSSWNYVEVKNVVVTFERMKDGTGLNLFSAQAALPDARYEPEMFSGLVHQSETGTENVYSTSRSIVTGVESTDQARQKHQELIEELDNYGLL